MKRIVLLNTPLQTYGDDRLFPCLGLASMAAILRNEGYICDIIDGELLDNYSIEKLAQQLVSYDLVGISATTPAFKTAVLIAQAIKRKRDIPIILGGHHATFLHQLIIEQYDCFDAIVRGEGETAIKKLCEEYFKYGCFVNVLDYVTYRNINGRVCVASLIATETDLNNLPFPVRDDFDRYFENGNNLVTISTSRGCVSGCSFCSSTNVRKNCATRSPKNIAEELFLIYQKSSDLKIAFVDDNFYIDPERAIQILSEIQEKCKSHFEFIFATRANQVLSNGEYNLKRIKDLGCIEIEMGIENGSDTVLQRYNKNITANENRLAIQMVEKHQIRVAVDYVLFDPKIIRSELKENIQFMKSAKLWGYDAPLIYERVIAFPGTDFTRNNPHLFNENCYIPSDMYFVDNQAKEIYDCLQSFRLLYQPKITRIIAKMRSAFAEGKISDTYRNDFLWLKLIPYLLLEKLVDSEGNYKELFDAIIHINEISKRIENYASYWGVEKTD